MLQSKYFLKTSKTTSEEDSIVSSKLLKQASYIAESVAGRFYFLPLGHRVQQKIMRVIKEEMDSIGALEMLAPVLHPLELWKETNRTNTTGFELMKVRDRRGSDFALGGTAEEMFVDLVRKFNISYKDLPFHLYQFSTKFRDELRARGGLLRVREFIMKDGYSFHVSEVDFRVTYETMKRVYSRIFERLGLKTYIVESDNGYIGGEYCHEFIVESEVGESKFFITASGDVCAHEDVVKFKRNPANSTENMLPLETISQPEWVKTMEDNENHYRKSKNHFLKNVVYKNRVSGQLVIAVVTGDLEVSLVKLEQALHAVGQLDSATNEDLLKIGTKTGYVHSWGHKGAYYVGDEVLLSARNLIGGQKETATDTINVNYGRDFKCDLIADIASATTGFVSLNNEKLIEKRGIEVGNIFQLGYHYSQLMKGAVFTDSDGQSKPYYMGCYGIGVGRTLAAIVEISHDDKGIIWPSLVAPFAVHIIVLGGKMPEKIYSVAHDLYNNLLGHGVEVLLDDRQDISAGEKFADSDLIGIPNRIVVSAKTLESGLFEWKSRASAESKMVGMEDLLELLNF